MLDRWIEPYTERPLAALLSKCEAVGLSCTHLALVRAGLGLLAWLAMGFHGYSLGLFLVAIFYVLALLSRAPGRANCKAAPFCCFLNRVIDPVFFGGMALFFAMGASQHALAAAFLIFSFLGLALTSGRNDAEQGNPDTEELSQNNGDELDRLIRLLSRLGDRSETTLFFMLACFFPSAFSALAFLYGIVCWTASLMRIWQQWPQQFPAASEIKAVLASKMQKQENKPEKVKTAKAKAKVEEKTTGGAGAVDETKAEEENDETAKAEPKRSNS